MSPRSVVRLLIAFVLLCPGAASAREIVVDYQAALKLARERAPEAIAGRGRVAESRGRRAGAGMRPNPEIEMQAGPRRLAGETSTDLEVGISQTFELGGRRGARIAMADAAVSREQAAADDALRQLLREVALAYYQALATEERLRLATSAEGIAVEALAVAEKRLAKGDLVELDLQLARLALARARTSTRAAEAEHTAAAGALAALLAIDPGDELRVEGDLRVRQLYARNDLDRAVGQRADLRALAFEAREGEAEAALGRGQRWPDLGLHVSYAREEEADIVLGGISLTLPFFDRGQEHRAAGTAKAVRARAERQARARAVSAEIRAALAAYEKRLAAVDEFEKAALPLRDESERLLRRSFETGQLDMADYLVARRELLDARGEHVDRLLELATAKVELEAAAGVLR